MLRVEAEFFKQWALGEGASEVLEEGAIEILEPGSGLLLRGWMRLELTPTKKR